MADKSLSQSSVNMTNDDGDDQHNHINGHSDQPIDDDTIENINNEVQSAMELLHQVNQDHSDIEESNTSENQSETNGYHDQDVVKNGSVESRPLEKDPNTTQQVQDDTELNLDLPNQLGSKERYELYQKGLR